MIAKDGFIFIFLALILTIIFYTISLALHSTIFYILSVMLAILTLFIIYFFRDPNRTFLNQDGLLISPADGKVLSVENIGHHEFIGSETTKISIFLNVFDVHVNRIPTDGIIDYVKYNPGKFHVAYVDKASEFNEQTEIGMTTKNNQKIIFKQIAGLIARRIVCKIKEGDTVETGARFGMIRFGSRTELFVPSDSIIEIKAGDRVVGSETIIGQLSSKEIKSKSKEKTA